MSSFPQSPKLVKGGIVLMDAGSGAIVRIIALQYNPATLSRSLQVQSAEAAGAGGDRSQALRLTGPPVETIKLEAEIDAADQLERPESNRTAVEFGIQPELAALELIIYPTSARLRENNALARSGTLEITPMEAPLTIFVWSKHRIVPVRINDFSIEEQFFDPALNPIRAKVNLGMRVLTVNDLGFDHRGGELSLVHQQQKERLASMSAGGSFQTLGITGISG
jgi:hypothetical protein